MFESPAALLRYQEELPLTPTLPGRSRIVKRTGPKRKDSRLCIDCYSTEDRNILFDRQEELARIALDLGCELITINLIKPRVSIPYRLNAKAILAAPPDPID
jgi:hypothetical protein